MTPLTGIDASITVPASVRKEGGASQYKAALGFEGMLLDRLSETLVKDGGLEDSPYASSVSDSFTSSLLRGGGIGIGEQLYATMMQQASSKSGASK